MKPFFARPVTCLGQVVAVALTAQVMLPAPAGAASLDDGLLVHLRLDGDAEDATGINLAGTTHGAISSTTGQSGDESTAIHIASGGWIAAPVAGLPADAGPRTVTLWVKPDFLPQFHSGGMLTYGVGDCVGKMTGLGVNQHRVTFWGGCQDFDSGLPLTANDWNFVAASYDGARLVVNVNGDVAQGQLALATVRTDTVWLGRETRTAGGSFDAQFLGALDDVRIYNRALSTTELAELFALGPDAAATNQPPRITLHPSSRAAVAGQTIELSVSARGGGGVVYQWFKDGDPLIGQTNSLLRLTNVGA
ncbi:MAG TPA: hypothetical protein PKE47_11535, partial [Verrucomicrobiota bacterium]|nr:hypothetical protein [Verrucomicrobiota bacterium]